jgi:PHD/YefM family antitoxin component YafN of YafNO toxin-antitoxin module
MHSIDLRNVYSLTDFVRNSKAHVDRIKETKAPEVLTVNGRAEVVVQDAESYQEMLDRLERADLIESLRQGIKDGEAGLGLPLEEAFAMLDAKYGV